VMIRRCQILKADLKHCQHPWPGCPIFGALFAPKVSIRALREPSPLNSPYFAKQNRHYNLNSGKNNLHLAGCLTLKNKSTFFPYD